MQKEGSNNTPVKTYGITVVFILIWNVLFSLTPLLLISNTAQSERLLVPTLQWFVKDTTTHSAQEKPIEKLKKGTGKSVWHDGWLYISVWMVSVSEYTMSNM